MTERPERSTEFTGPPSEARARLDFTHQEHVARIMKEPDALEAITAFLEKRPPRWRSAIPQP